MVITSKWSQSCGMWIPLFAIYKEIVSKLRNMNTIVWQLQGNRLKVADYEYQRLVVKGVLLKVAEYEYHCVVVTRKPSQRCGIWIPLYGSYKEIVSNVRNIKTIAWWLQGNCLKIAEYECRCVVFTRKLSQSCGIWKPTHGSYKEIFSKLRNLNFIV